MTENGFGGALSMLLMLAVLTTPLCGCSSTAPSRYYSLSPVRASEGESVSEHRTLSVGVTRIRLPDYLDRPQIATRITSNEFRFDEFNRWAEPLKENFSRVLADNLAVFLGTDRVLLLDWAGSVPLDFQVWVDVTRFEAAPSGDVTLTARWALYRQDEKKLLVTKNFRRVEGAGTPGYDAMAAAASRAVAALSREIADAIRSGR